jgi:hypothetical protein
MTPIPTAPLFIGYPDLSSLVITLDKNEPVYVLNTLETSKGVGEGQRTDHHYVTVSQPDVHNRVHYLRIPVVRLTFLNGIAFAPDYASQLSQVEQNRAEVWQWLEARGYMLRAAVVALPSGFDWISGKFE